MESIRSPCCHVTTLSRWQLFQSPPPPAGESARANVLHQSGDIAWRQHHVVCLKADFLWHTIISNENCAFYTYDIYSQLNKSGCPLMGSHNWWRFGFGQAGVPTCADDMPHRSCANFKCRVADVNNWIPIDFRAVKFVSVESDQTCCDNVPWYIQFD